MMTNPPKAHGRRLSFGQAFYRSFVADGQEPGLIRYQLHSPAWR